MALLLVALPEDLVELEETDELDLEVEPVDELLVTEPDAVLLEEEPELLVLVPLEEVLEDELEIVLSVEGLLEAERLTEEALVRVVLLPAVEAEVLLLV